MNLIFFGPPGGGKGTQARLLAARRGFPQISTGDILREAVAAGTALGREARRYMDAGDLVPDAVMIGLIQERLDRADARQGFTLDGFPRTLHQAQALERLLETMARAIDRAVEFRIDEDTVIRRLTGRRVCTAAGHIYHVEFAPPRQEGICDRDGTPLRQRDDDQPDVIRRRLEVYRREIPAVLAFYRARGVLTPLDAAGDEETVYARLAEALAAA
ncbi:MAG: adenylate kinase [bacterium]